MHHVSSEPKTHQVETSQVGQFGKLLHLPASACISPSGLFFPRKAHATIATENDNFQTVLFCLIFLSSEHLQCGEVAN